MTILEGNIKLLKSQVMDDVAEGGGRATGNTIVDGASNSIFADISELDRAGGRVNLRKTFVSVDTADTDGYYGVNVIVAKPPADPRVSCTMFTTNDGFDHRSGAQSRLESYLAVGPAFAGYLFGNHLSGQRTVSIIARTNVPLPVVGTTLVLTSALATQFIRITDVSSRKRDFEDASGVFQRSEFTLSISDPLRTDYAGYAAARFDAAYAGATSIHETVVADAARYYGASPLKVLASTGDFSAVVESTFTPLVPSAQVETPIADARMNQQTGALIASGGVLNQTINSILTTTQALYIGGTILPGTLTIARAGITLVDSGGKLLNQATLAEVGAVDYANGILTMTTNVFGTGSGAHVIGYTPAGVSTVVSQSIGLPVTQVSQRLTWVVSLDPIPAKGTLQVSYLAQGRWYVLTEDGSGKVSGGDPAFGVGNLNFQTGTVSLTLGALPEEGSQVILSWAPTGGTQPRSAIPVSPRSSVLISRFFIPIQLTQPIKPGSLTLTWNDGVARTAVDSSGVLTGDAIGTVNYSNGLIRFSPNVLPAKNTVVNTSILESSPQAVSTPYFTDAGANWTFSLGMTVRAKTVDMAVCMNLPVRQYPGTDLTQQRVVRVFDDGAGALQIANVDGNLTVGAIDYTTGAASLIKSLANVKDIQTVYVNVTPLGGAGDPANIVIKGTETRVLTGSILNSSVGNVFIRPVWAWWVAASAGIAESRFGGTDGATVSGTVTLDSIYMSGTPTSFTLGAHLYKLSTYEVIAIDPSPVTGEGTVVGSQSHVYSAAVSALNYNYLGGDYSIGSTALTTWTAGVSSLASALGSLVNPILSGADSNALVDAATFRTAIAPIRNGSFSLSGLTADGVTITATADADGVINDPTHGVFGTINYNTGVVSIRFGVPVGSIGIGVTNIAWLGVPGAGLVRSIGVRADSLRYNASAYTYLPLSADILGLDPVRLPSDGRVPIFRTGSFAVASHTATRAPQTVANGQTVDLGRVRLSRVRVIGNNGVTITAGYTTDLDAGTVSFTDITGYSQPIHIENRIEDMMLVSDAQLSGRLTFTRPLTHDYPLGAYVSSALVIGDMRARVPVLFDQTTWASVWSDLLAGSAAPATFNDVLAPIEVTNKGAITERWVIQFTNTTSFNVIGENVGVIASGNTATDCAPVNPATGVAYFTIRATGWGSGWAAGNALRFNTIGSLFPVWIARTVQQGPATAQDDSFTVLVRGDIDKP